jgi:hypothetical protein
LSDFKEYFKKGVRVKYFPDDKVLLMTPGKDKDDFLRLKSQIDTLLQIDGTKRVGNAFSLKLNDNFNVSIEELLKSIGMKGGIEEEDAQSMVDDEAEDQVKEDEKEQAPEVQANPEMQAPQLEAVFQNGVFNFLFESDLFQPGPDKPKKKAAKRHGKYWEPLERIKGKNRNELKPEEIIELRKKFSIKPFSEDRNKVLRSLDKAANYFHKRIGEIKSEMEAEKFHQDYISIDNLRPSDYGGDDEEKIDTFQSNVTVNNSAGGGMSLMPDFDDISYSNIDVEDN